MAKGDVELSIVMPVHDEASTLPQILRRLGTVEFRAPTELIIVDDGSTDGGVDGVDRAWLPNMQRVRVVRSRVNRGKGHALRRGFALAEGDFLGVQDADLEYEPAQIPELVAPLRDGRADAVFGSRQFGAASSYSFWYLVGNRFVSLAASALFDRYVTDAYTCHKFFSARRTSRCGSRPTASRSRRSSPAGCCGRTPGSWSSRSATRHGRGRRARRSAHGTGCAPCSGWCASGCADGETPHGTR